MQNKKGCTPKKDTNKEQVDQEILSRYAHQEIEGGAWYCSKCEQDHPTKEQAIRCCEEIKKRDARAQYFPLKIGREKCQMKIRLEGDKFFYCIIKDNIEGLETKVSIDFYQDEEKRRKFCKNVINTLGGENKKRKEKIKKSLEEILLEIQKKNIFKIELEPGNGETWKQRKLRKRDYFIHGAGGVYDHLVIEPLGDYRYIYNYNGKKGISQVSFNPKTKESTIDVEGDTFYFTSEPLKDVLFKVPSEESITAYLNGNYKVKTSKELYTAIVNYLKILYDVPSAFYYHIIAIGELQSWIIHLLNVVFYLSFSARFGAGKTAFLEGLGTISHHGFLAGNITSSSLARMTNKYKLSLFGDELDVKAKGKDNETYLVFRQGYKRGNPYIRSKETNQGYTEEIIDVFSFKGYSVHSKSEDALATRGIDVPLMISTDKTLPILNMFKEQLGFPLFEDLFFWYLSETFPLFEVFSNWKRKRKRGPTEGKNDFVSSVSPFPRFYALNSKEIKKIRENLFSEYTKIFSKEEIKTLKKFLGRNEELLFVALSVCKIFKIDKYVYVKKI